MPSRGYAPREAAGCAVGPVGQTTCGVVGFGLAVVALAFGYSGVVAVASALPLLSTTAVVFVGVFLWLAAWFGLVLAAGAVRARLSGAREL